MEGSEEFSADLLFHLSTIHYIRYRDESQEYIKITSTVHLLMIRYNIVRWLGLEGGSEGRDIDTGFTSFFPHIHYVPKCTVSIQ